MRSVERLPYVTHDVASIICLTVDDGVMCPGCNALFHATCLGFNDGEKPDNDW
jgi:hypothetical protein